MESPKKNRSRNDPFYVLARKNIQNAAAGDVKSHRWVVDHFCPIQIEKALDGDHIAGRWLLREFCVTVQINRNSNRKHTLFNDGLLDYISNAIIKILNGVPPKQALRIAKIKRRPEIHLEKHFNRDVVICDKILELRNSGKCDNLEVAKAMAARQLKLGRATINASWNNTYAKACAEEFPGIIKRDW